MNYSLSSKTRHNVLGAIAVSVVLVLPVRAVPNPELVGVEGVDVIIEDLPQEVASCGLTEAGLRDIIDSSLLAAELPASDTAAAAFIYLKIEAMEASYGLWWPAGYVYRIDCDLRQPARLIEHPATTCQTITWHRGCLGTTGYSRPRLRRTIVTTVERYVDEFIAEYRVANAP